MDYSHRKVSFAQSWVLFFKNYANFSGRSSRSAYWFWMLWLVIVTLSIEILKVFTSEAEIVYIIDGLWFLGTIVPMITIYARRLHDVGRSGWWQLIAFTIIGIIPLLIWYVRAGDSETNKYGDNVEQIW